MPGVASPQSSSAACIPVGDLDRPSPVIGHPQHHLTFHEEGLNAAGNYSGGGAVGNKGVPVGMRPPSYTSSTAVAFSCYEVLDLGMNGFPS